MTKTGDKRQTDCGGRRVDKDNLLVEVVGEIDELQAVIQLISQSSWVSFEKRNLVNDLSIIMGKLGSCEKKFQSLDLEFQIKKMEEKIEKNNLSLNKFVVFKTKKAKELNWVRAVSRRVERRVVALSKKEKINENILKYFNRLSDYLFILAVRNN